MEQERNKENNRQVNLSLTEAGLQIYEDHQQFIRECQQSTFCQLDRFTPEELAHHLQVQLLFNQSYESAVRRSRERFTRRD